MRLVLNCFRHHRHLELDLPDTGVVLFAGPSGAGKSTVLAAFEFLFYGKLRNISSFDTKSTSVTLVYKGIALRQLADEEGEAPAEITILRKRGPALLRLSYEDKIYEGDEAQGVINRLFGATLDVFMAASYLKQGERSLLLDGKNADKMELIEKLTFSDDDIASRKETIQSALRETDKALSTANGVLKTLENQIASFQVLHERPLALLAQERASRQPPPTITAESLEQEYQEVQSRREECWQRKTELEVQERTRANISQQVSKLQATLKGDGGKTPAELELQILSTTQERGVAAQWEEYFTVRKQDQTRISEFKRRYPQYGTLKPVDTSVPSATEQHHISSELSRLEQADAEYRRFRTQNERTQKELAEIASKLQAALGAEQPPSVEEVEAYLERAAKELATAKQWQLYLTARAQDQRRLADFKQRYPQYGSLAASEVNPVTAQEQRSLSAERDALVSAEFSYRTYQSQTERLQQALDTFSPELPTFEELKTELDLIGWQEAYRQVAHYQEPTLTPGRYPDDLDTVHQMISELESRQRRLLDLAAELQALGVGDGEELQQRLSETRVRLETCGTRVQCPQCREDLIFSQGTLRCTQSLRKSKPLPPRIGSARAIGAPMSPVPSTPASPPLVLCSDPPSLLEGQIREYERVLALLAQSPSSGTLTANPATTLAECETELAALRDWRQKLTSLLTEKETLRQNLEEKRRLEKVLQGRSTKRSQAGIMELLQQLSRRQQLQTTLEKLPVVPPVDASRLQEVQQLLAAIEVQQTASLFTQQDELEYQAREKRLDLVQIIYPESKRDRLEELDTQELRAPARDASLLEILLATTQALLQRQQTLLESLKDVAPVDEDRMLELRRQLAAIDHQRKEEQLAALFRQQDELEQQARDKRLHLLQRLHLTSPLSELELLDSGKLLSPVESVAALDARIEDWRRQLTLAIKTQEARERIKDLQATLQVVPASVAGELVTVSADLVKFKTRGEALQELKRCLTLELELQNLQNRLQEQRNTNQAETKKYAVLDKLRLKLLEAETITLESTVASINLELAQQLESLFDTPISVRFETTKQQANGNFKHCVNLNVNYRGQSYDDIGQLSGGEAARVSLAITLALNKAVGSPLLLLDESLSALDGDLVDTVIDTLKVASASSHIPIFVVLHNNVQGLFDEVVEFA
jgi:DNA repair exonuclease SbcCD ATPase subunit